MHTLHVNVIQLLNLEMFESCLCTGVTRKKGGFETASKSSSCEISQLVSNKLTTLNDSWPNNLPNLARPQKRRPNPAPNGLTHDASNSDSLHARGWIHCIHLHCIILNSWNEIHLKLTATPLETPLETNCNFICSRLLWVVRNQWNASQCLTDQH